MAKVASSLAILVKGAVLFVPAVALLVIEGIVSRSQVLIAALLIRDGSD